MILASTSPYRRALLARLRLDFSVLGSGVDESRLAGESPLGLATRLAHAKARHIAAGRPDAWVVGSDQVAVRGEDILGKPGTHARCIEMLRGSSGRTVTFLTAVAVVREADAARHEFVDRTEVVFRNLEEDTIARYVEAEEPLDCAGGFKSEGLGVALCKSIETRDPTALIGLPLLMLASVLRGVGYRIP